MYVYGFLRTSTMGGEGCKGLPSTVAITVSSEVNVIFGFTSVQLFGMFTINTAALSDSGGMVIVSGF